MKRNFNTKITEIKNIGDELRFQREYYNFKNSPYKYSKKSSSGRNSKFIGYELKEYLKNNFSTYRQKDAYNTRDNFGEYGSNEDIIDAIENEKFRDSTEDKYSTYYPESYYLRIYSLFKIYGFLDDYEILMLLDKYNINPRFEKSKQERLKLREKCFMDYSENPRKKSFNLRSCMLDNFHIENELKIAYPKLKHICFKEYEEKILNGCYTSICFRNLKTMLLEKFNALTELEKKYISLELGKDTSFVCDVLHKCNPKGSKEQIYITLETLLKIINYLALDNSDLEFIVNKKIEINNENHRKNIDDIQQDRFNFRKMWGI